MRIVAPSLRYAAMARHRNLRALRHRVIETSVEVEAVEVASEALVPVMEFGPRGDRTTVVGHGGRLYVPAGAAPEKHVDTTVRTYGAIVEGDQDYVVVSHEKERALASAASSLLLCEGTLWGACVQPYLHLSHHRGMPSKVALREDELPATSVGLDPARTMESLRAVHRQEFTLPTFDLLRPDLVWDTGEVRDLLLVGTLVAERMRKSQSNAEDSYLRALMGMDEALKAFGRELYHDHATWHLHGTKIRTELRRCLDVADPLPKPMRRAAEFATTECPGLDLPPPAPEEAEVPEDDVAAFSAM